MEAREEAEGKKGEPHPRESGGLPEAEAAEGARADGQTAPIERDGAGAACAGPEGGAATRAGREAGSCANCAGLVQWWGWCGFPELLAALFRRKVDWVGSGCKALVHPTTQGRA